MRPAPVTLLTDFGIEDTYVGQMKGVIAGIAPAALVIDLTHAVRPQQVEQGAFLLETALKAFPAGTVHLAVVDPGVGTARAALAVRAGDRLFVGPDNGLLSCALSEAARPAAPASVPVPADVAAVALAPEPGRPVSATFHGRDIFAVAAARLANGASLPSLGTPVEAMYALPPFRGRTISEGMVEGRVVHIDRFGNVVATIRAGEVGGRLRAVELGGARITNVVRTYAEGSGLVALVGSSDYLEVAEVNGDAAARLGARIGMAVRAELA